MRKSTYPVLVSPTGLILRWNPKTRQWDEVPHLSHLATLMGGKL